jgi:hypothetical protein
VASFNLTPTKQRTFLDPVVFTKKPGFDYVARADESWRSIEDHLLTIADTEAVYRRTESRIVAGTDWLQGNKENPRYMEGYQLMRELENERTNLAININSLRRVVWNECCTLYACSAHMNFQRWLTDREIVGIDGFDHRSPEGIWQTVMPGDEPPGSWPEVPSEKYIERKAHYIGWDVAR